MLFLFTDEGGDDVASEVACCPGDEIGFHAMFLRSPT
jgi:hypothetical protein